MLYQTEVRLVPIRAEEDQSFADLPRTQWDLSHGCLTLWPLSDRPAIERESQPPSALKALSPSRTDQSAS